ncbi:MAG: PTS sugar transporter subunit IIA [Proteobacteria bacterium]|nr:helix-turn-helix domain-containing protein [Desulfobacteraceae bacterium]MBU3981159.1 PTS sugar transporter subunit IIA [Pseudomonadota bacterium]MBU4068774.1 PTS sugar transporter subunit IIA [Pseudomonadota bacterium]MBU4102086.1 PTS sugar transporter subunit IIA [Pseudomonadota bacterium]MBU4125981.1 PTS sugar transporter subunit IIA [Pseudomonadota bacterium]
MKLSLKDIARCLDLPASTVDRWIRQGRIPIHRSENVCIFKKSIIEKWAFNHGLPFSPLDKEKEIYKKQTLKLENLIPAMQFGGVFHGIKGDDVESVLKSAVDKVPVLPINKEGLYERLLEREALTSTGIGKGVAIPHPRAPLPEEIDNPLITTCFLEKSIDFEAIDDRPVFVMFILLSTSIKNHLHLLSRLAFCVRDDSFVKFLRTYPDSSSLLSKIADCENLLDRDDN